MIYIQYLIIAEAAWIYVLLEHLYWRHETMKWMDEWRKSYDERMMEK